jgi:hypothetical protein
MTVYPEWSPYEGFNPVTDRDLGSEFFDLTGRADAMEKINRKEFVKMGQVTYKTTWNEKVFEALKSEGKRMGGDAITKLKKDHILGEWVGAEIIKYK